MPDKYDYGAKGEFHHKLVGAMHFVNSIGICQFGYASYPIETWTSFYGAITGQEVTWEDALKLGERIGNLRLAFNLREGINPLLDHKVPEVVVGSPPPRGRQSARRHRGRTAPGERLSRGRGLGPPPALHDVEARGARLEFVAKDLAPYADSASVAGCSATRRRASSATERASQ